MHPHLRRLVAAARAQGLLVMIRTNLTILLEDGYQDFPGFFRDHRVHLVASLPCYLEDNVDRQRGRGVHSRSVEAIRLLNQVGYGAGSQLPLDLVYNPLGPSLPPDPLRLEADYRRELLARHGIRFTRLITITNMPIGRFLHDLQRDGKLEGYRRLLEEKFNAETLSCLMCRHQVHVSWDGRLHDCDFNYALGLGTTGEGGLHIRDFDPAAFARRRILTADHCFGCTAGPGSSCGGALVG
jgi:radical SAM/Cys-rich protein